jgi:hypothetical protein
MNRKNPICTPKQISFKLDYMLLVARLAAGSHNPEVVGSKSASATLFITPWNVSVFDAGRLPPDAQACRPAFDNSFLLIVEVRIYRHRVPIVFLCSGNISAVEMRISRLDYFAETC